MSRTLIARIVLTDEHYNVSISGNVTRGDHRAFAMASREMTNKEFRAFNLRWMEAALPHLCEGGVCRFPPRFDPGFPIENLTRLDDGFGVRGSSVSRFLLCGFGGFRRALFLKRKLSFPVSRKWKRWVRRTSITVVIFASPNTVTHTPKLRLVVMITQARS